MTEAATFAAGIIYIHRRPSRVPTQAQNSGVLPLVYAQVKIMQSFPSEDALGEIKQPRLPHYPTFIPPLKSKKFVYVRLCTGMNRREPVGLIHGTPPSSHPQTSPLYQAHSGPTSRSPSSRAKARRSRDAGQTTASRVITVERRITCRLPPHRCSAVEPDFTTLGPNADTDVSVDFNVDL